MELPREIMLSSDPDLHAFWASQISRIGEVPWNQGLWGPDRFFYPAGFAVLNYTWSVFSGLSIPEIVTAQPLIQTQFCLALLAWTACLQTSDRARSPQMHVILFILLLVVYYAFLPFGYQHSHLHLEGTGRLSASLLTATCFSTALIFSRGVVTREVSVGDTLRYVLFVGSILALIALLNPGTVIIPSCFFAASILLYLFWGLNRGVVKRAGVLIGVVPPFLQLLLGDPYYFDMLGLPDHTGGESNRTASLLSTLVSSGMTSFRSLLSDPKDALSSFVTLDLLSPQATWQTFWAVGFTYAITSAWSRFRKDTFDPLDWLLITIITFWWLTYSLLFLPIAISLSGPPPAGLLYPYLVQSLQQNMFILLMFLIAVILRRVWTHAGWWVSCVLVFALLKPMLSLSASSNLVTVKPRYAYSGSMGDLTADDQSVIRYIEDFSRNILAKYPNANFRDVPKILIPNQALQIGQERWLFSFGGARVLPFKDSLPIAFYYSQGNSSQFGWDAYKKNVCKGLNRVWMSEKNIRFVFIPSQIAGSCAAVLRNSIRRQDVLFQSGDAMFAKIL